MHFTFMKVLIKPHLLKVFFEINCKEGLKLYLKM